MKPLFALVCCLTVCSCVGAAEKTNLVQQIDANTLRRFRQANAEIFPIDRNGNLSRRVVAARKQRDRLREYRAVEILN